uniref:Uncharacterized protein n=1 Tax=Geospiza parvula TaxID=87175 RepID=A0A8U8BAQ0_GEOPR
MSFPQLGYQYIRPLYPAERPGSGGSRGGAELAPSGTLSNVLSSMYGAPYAAAAAAQGYGAFLPYAAEARGCSTPPSPPHPAFYPYGQYQFGDPSRPKNATRESTSTLKAWLNEHRKNPYPTKGEKIMLAIITKMTLTQVSTWFANARRRLKKENKMTWAPRSRTDEEGNSYGSDHEGEEDKREDEEEIDLENIDTENIESNKDELEDDLQDADLLHSDSKTDSEGSEGFEDLPGSEERYDKVSEGEPHHLPERRGRPRGRVRAAGLGGSDGAPGPARSGPARSCRRGAGGGGRGPRGRWRRSLGGGSLDPRELPSSSGDNFCCCCCRFCGKDPAAKSGSLRGHCVFSDGHLCKQSSRCVVFAAR